MKNDKVLLRPIEYGDIDFLHRWRNDKTIFENLGGGYTPRSKSQINKWMDSFVDNSDFDQKFLICNTIKPVGYIALNNINYKNGTSDLGIYIGEKDEWGKGYAFFALGLIKNYAKNVLNIRKISLKVLEDNIAAIKLYEKSGFTQCGCKIEDRYVDGEYKNVILMEILL